jgi:hypothetical protein
MARSSRRSPARDPTAALRALSRRLAAALAFLLLLGPAAAAQTSGGKPASPKPESGDKAGSKGADADATAAPKERRFEDLTLTLSFPPGLALAEQARPKDAQVRAAWAGTAGASALRMQLIVLPVAQFGFIEPSEVMDVIGSNLRDPGNGGSATFVFDELSHVTGRFGYADYATLARSTETEEEGPVQVLRLSGLLENDGYVLELRARPPLAPADEKLVLSFLQKGVTSDGPQRDPKWTKDEARQRWEEGVPDELAKELDDVLRTPHYVILTNSSGGKTFAKKMEECYAAIRKTYPFDEVPGRRLMPMFLFRTNDQYYAFIAKTFGMTVDDAKRTGGIAYADFYSSWYEAPGDPVHIHEATHQIVRNRLGLSGGGSWFQEGLAEYVSSKPNERGMAARAVEKGTAVPLGEFMRKESLIFSSPADDKSGADLAGDQYKQAALLIEFLRESKFGKAKFPEWMRAVGVTRSNDVDAIEAVTRRIYGVDIDGLQKEFVAYCKKR